MQEKTDMFLVNLPWADLLTPHLAPALLKGIAESYGYTIKTHDFNIDFKEIICANDQKTFEEYQDYFISILDKNSSTGQIVEKFYNLMIDRLKKENFRFLGISVFSVYTQKSTFELCKKIRKELPTIKIVLGGRGLNVKPHLSVEKQLESDEKLKPFSEVMLNRNLCDKLIIGDAEDAIIDLFADNVESNNLNWYVAKQENLEYPFSNFDDYDLKKYQGIAGNPQLHVISSKGCVRKCDFCDVGFQFKKFKSKDGRRFAEEVIYLSNKYKINEFATADSILNGNIKTLKETLQVLAEHNKDKKESEKIKWGGNWICRPPGRLPPEFFDLMAAGGCRHLNVGAEHGSNQVLQAMDKKTNVEGLYYEIEQMHRTGIQCGLNNVIGHWSEKYEDWLAHIEMLLKIGPYIANRTVTQVMIGSGFAILGDTPAAWNKEINGLEFMQDNFSFAWYTKKNPSLTYKTRIARLINLYRLAFALKYPVSQTYQNLLTAKNRYAENYEQALKFLTKYLDKESYKKCYSVDFMSNEEDFNNLINEKLKEYFPLSTLNLEVESSEFNGSPGLEVIINNKVVFKDVLPEGSHNFEFIFKNEFDKNNQIDFILFNKKERDTKIDKEGNIIKDKNIIFKKIVLDKINLVKDQEYFYKHSNFYEKGIKLEIAKPGLYLDKDHLQFFYKGTFWVEFINKRFKNEMSWQLNSFKDYNQVIEQLKEICLSYEY